MSDGITAQAAGSRAGRCTNGNRIVGGTVTNRQQTVYGQTTREGDDWRKRSNKRPIQTRSAKVDTHKCIL